MNYLYSTTDFAECKKGQHLGGEEYGAIHTLKSRDPAIA